MIESKRDPDDVNLDGVFQALADERRRLALQCLHEHEEPMTLDELADQIAAREYGGPVTEIPADEVKRIYLSLYHVHVPKLEETWLVRFDEDERVVSRSDHAGLPEDPIAGILDVVVGAE